MIEVKIVTKTIDLGKTQNDNESYRLKVILLP